jgi:hypothetical protein
MLRTVNTAVGGILAKMNRNGHLAPKAKMFLRMRGIEKQYATVKGKMRHILEEKEEETWLKILLICEFCKYTLNYAQLCISDKEEQ